MAVLHVPLGGCYTSLGQKEEPELTPVGRGETHSFLGGRGQIPTTPRYADTAVGYPWGPGKTIEMGQRVGESWNKQEAAGLCGTCLGSG